MLSFVVKEKVSDRPFSSSDEVFTAMQVIRATPQECDRRTGHLHLSTFQFIATRLMEHYANYFAFYNVMDLTFTSAPELPELSKPNATKRQSVQRDGPLNNAKSLLRRLRDIDVSCCRQDTCGHHKQLQQPMKERGIQRVCPGCFLKFSKAQPLMIGTETPSELGTWIESKMFESIVVPALEPGHISRSWRNVSMTEPNMHGQAAPDHRGDRGRGQHRAYRGWTEPTRHGQTGLDHRGRRDCGQHWGHDRGSEWERGQSIRGHASSSESPRTPNLGPGASGRQVTDYSSAAASPRSLPSPAARSSSATGPPLSGVDAAALSSSATGPPLSGVDAAALPSSATGPPLSVGQHLTGASEAAQPAKHDEGIPKPGKGKERRQKKQTQGGDKPAQSAENLGVVPRQVPPHKRDEQRSSHRRSDVKDLEIRKKRRGLGK